jgi:hypothetical protein
MLPELIVLVTKLDKILSSIEGKKGVPNDKLSNIIPSADGSTLPGQETKKIPDTSLKRLGTFFETGKFVKRNTVLKYARNFADGFLPKLSVTLTDVFKPFIKTLTNIVKSKDSGESGGVTPLSNLGGLAKNLLVFIPALGAFTYIAMQWGGIETSSIVKMFTALGIFFGGIIALNKTQSKINMSLMSVASTLLKLAGLAGVIMLFKKSLEGWESIGLASIGKVGLIIGGIVGIVTGLGLIPKQRLTAGGLAFASIEVLALGLSLILPLLATGISALSGVEWSEIGKVATILAGIGAIVAALAIIPKSLLLAGVLAFAGIEALAFGLSLVLPPLATAIQSLSGVKWGDLGKVAVILTSIGVIAGALGVLAATGIGAVALAAGAAAFAGILALAYGLSMVLPPLATAVQSLSGVKWEDLGKAGVVIAGISTLATAMGVATPFVIAANLGMSAFSEFVDGITNVINKVVTTVTSLSKISSDGITGGFAKIKQFIESTSTLFTGEGFIGKVGGFIKNLATGGAASALVAPYIALAFEIQTLSSIIANTVTNISKVGSVGSINSAMSFIKSFLDGTGMFGGLVVTDNISNITNSLISLTSIVPNINALSISLEYLGSTMLSFAKVNPFSTFETAKTTIDSLTESVNRLKTSFGDIDVKSSINVVSETPLKVDMTTTNEILYKMYQTSVEMVSVLKNLPASGNNVIIAPNQRGGGKQTGAPVMGGFDGFKGSPYAYR